MHDATFVPYSETAHPPSPPSPNTTAADHGTIAPLNLGALHQAVEEDMYLSTGSVSDFKTYLPRRRSEGRTKHITTRPLVDGDPNAFWEYDGMERGWVPLPHRQKEEHGKRGGNTITGVLGSPPPPPAPHPHAHSTISESSSPVQKSQQAPNVSTFIPVASIPTRMLTSVRTALNGVRSAIHSDGNAPPVPQAAAGAPDLVLVFIGILLIISFARSI